MKNNLMPKIAEMLGVKLGERVTIEWVNDSTSSWEVILTDKGLKFCEAFYRNRMERALRLSEYPTNIKLISEEDFVLKNWLCGEFRVKGSFPKNGDKVFSLALNSFLGERGYPRIEEFEFDSSSQFHLLLKDKGLLHETLEEAVKCFEKDYNTFKEIRG